MRPESTLLLRLLTASGGSLAVAAGLAMLAGMAAVGLVASAGWLITASALAGLAGIGLEIFFPGAIVRFLALTRTLSRYGERLLGHAAIFSALARLRSAVFAALTKLPLASLSQRNRAHDLQRLMRDIERLEAWPVRLVLPLAGLLAGTLLTLALVSISLGWVAATVSTLVLIACASALAWWPAASRRRGLRSASLRRRHANTVVETLHNAAALWHIDPEQATMRRCQRLFERSRGEQARLERQAIQREGTQQLLLGALALALLALGALTPWQAISPAWHLLAVLAVFALANLLPGLTLAVADFPGLWLSARAVLPDSDEHNDHGARDTAGVEAGASALTFRHLRVETGWREPPLFEAFNWQVNTGEWWAVCGASGSGKSTLARLLAGLQLPSVGEVSISACRADRLSDQQRLARIAFLTQDTVMLADTLRANLLLAARGPVDDLQLMDCLDRVGLSPLRDQLERWLGESGQPLSGGQARRVALIRTLLSAAPVLVLDEPFRGLDDASRRQTSQWLWQAAKGRTLLLLDHAPPANWAGRVLDIGETRHGGPL